MRLPKEGHFCIFRSADSNQLRKIVGKVAWGDGLKDKGAQKDLRFLVEVVLDAQVEAVPTWRDKMSSRLTWLHKVLLTYL